MANFEPKTLARSLAFSCQLECSDNVVVVCAWAAPSEQLIFFPCAPTLANSLAPLGPLIANNFSQLTRARPCNKSKTGQISTVTMSRRLECRQRLMDDSLARSLSRELCDREASYWRLLSSLLSSCLTRRATLWPSARTPPLPLAWLGPLGARWSKFCWD